MELEQIVTAAVHDVLPDIPVMIIKEQMQLFPDTDAKHCAELVVRNIVENYYNDFEKEQDHSDISHKNAVSSSIPSTSDGPAALGVHNKVPYIMKLETSSSESSPLAGVTCNYDGLLSLENSEASGSSTVTSDTEDLKIVLEIPSSRTSVIKEASFTVSTPSVTSIPCTSATLSPNHVTSVPQMLTTDALQTVPLTTLTDIIEQIEVPAEDKNDNHHLRMGVYETYVPENQRFGDERQTLTVEKVLSVLPDTPVERIQALMPPVGDFDPCVCAENIIRLLLEGDEADQEVFIADDPVPEIWPTAANTMPDNLIADSEEPRVNQKRKRSGDDFGLPDLEIPDDSQDKDMFECNCCYNEVLFEDMVQCADGHLFCAECLRKYTEESVYGQGRRTLTCMFDGCDEMFPSSQLARALPETLRLKYEERIAEEVLNLANLENLTRCPFCNYQALLDDDQHIFVCPNPSCQKRSCRKCGTAWEEHDGLQCSQIEKETETKIRTDYEEKMANSRIRTCPSCKARFTKESGCNRITCRCGQQLCYICRQTIKGYDHFCQHVRNPGKPCDKCEMCFLWTDSEYDDELAISEIKKEALLAREQQGFQEKKDIGAPDDPNIQKKLQDKARHMHHYHQHRHAGRDPRYILDILRRAHYARGGRRRAQNPGMPNLDDIINQVAIGALPLREGNAGVANLPVPQYFAAAQQLPPQPAGQPLAHQPAGQPLAYQPAGQPLAHHPAGQPLAQHPARPAPAHRPVRHPAIYYPYGEFPEARYRYHYPIVRAAQLNVFPTIKAVKVENGFPCGAQSAANPKHTFPNSDVLDDCQSLIRNMQAQMRNLAGPDGGRIQEAEQQLRNIAQQATNLASKLKQQKVKKPPTNQQLQKVMKVAPPVTNQGTQTMQPVRLVGIPQAADQTINDYALKKIDFEQKKVDRRKKVANLATTLVCVNSRPCASAIKTEKPDFPTSKPADKTVRTKDGTVDQGFYLASTISRNAQCLYNNPGNGRRPEAALGAAPPATSGRTVNSSSLSSLSIPGPSTDPHQTYQHNVRNWVTSQNNLAPASKTNTKKKDKKP